jgi:hypothetical protein
MKRKFEGIEIIREDRMHVYGRYKSGGADHEAGDLVMLPKNVLAQALDWIEDMVVIRSGVFYGSITAICLIGVIVFGKLLYELDPRTWGVSGDVIFIAIVTVVFVALAALFAYWWISESIIPWVQRKAYTAKNRA